MTLELGVSVKGIPQVPNNGDLPTISISGLTGLGVSSYCPTIATMWDFELTENVTKLYRTHAFKMGVQRDSLEGDMVLALDKRRKRILPRVSGLHTARQTHWSFEQVMASPMVLSGI